MKKITIILCALLLLSVVSAQAQNNIMVQSSEKDYPRRIQVFVGATADKDIPPNPTGKAYVVTGLMLGEDTCKPMEVIYINGVQVIPDPSEPLPNFEAAPTAFELHMIEAARIEQDYNTQKEPAPALLQMLAEHFRNFPDVAKADPDQFTVKITFKDGETMKYALGAASSEVLKEHEQSVAVRRIQHRLDDGYWYFFPGNQAPAQSKHPCHYDRFLEELNNLRDMDKAAAENTEWEVLRPKSVAAVLVAKGEK